MGELTLDEVRRFIAGRMVARVKLALPGRMPSADMYEYNHDIVLVPTDALIKMVQNEWRQKYFNELGLPVRKSSDARGVTPWSEWSKGEGILLPYGQELRTALSHSRTKDGKLRLYQAAGRGSLMPVYSVRGAGVSLIFEVGAEYQTGLERAAENHLRS